ncbi:MAG: deoxyribodipyrimidine photo-lyase [Leptospiraceae bacterium]|nr:deoxyribodipyrimidine photo-lyase [Leptospiraceae bacterium]MCP5496739.1 deoxyribodipyrimidine photo-lyase [Leptospiraceae bacterium]
MENYGIHWFRRDLRIVGNNALEWNRDQTNGNVLGFFCFDKKFLSRSDFSINRFQFFIETLIELKKNLKSAGSDLLVLDKDPLNAFSDLFFKLKSHEISLPTYISWGKDYEPFAVERDKQVANVFQKHGINIHSERDHLLIEPHELIKDQKTKDGYQIYTPFSKKWLEIFQTEKIQKRIEVQKKALESFKIDKHKESFCINWDKLFHNIITYPDHLAIYSQKNKRQVTVSIPESGFTVAFELMKAFQKKIGNYSKSRDIPFLNGTSHFAQFLKNGSLTVSQIIAFFGLTPYKKPDSPRDKFFSELIWREFYYHILYRHPYVETESFLLKYKNIQWENNPKWFAVWKDGLTGFPIVDAGMRELKTTGWMHNRVRMIVASFLTKDLLIDWRWGEKYFMEQLLDGDLAPNNGGWQWAASTGCDPQPYFRIFNPWLQSKKFDPNGDYIRKYVPELKDVESNKLHQPILDHKLYPKPIVEHEKQKEKALSLYHQPHIL